MLWLLETISSSSVTVIEGQVAFTNVSDGRIKENVQETVPVLSFIANLRLVTYTLNTRTRCHCDASNARHYKRKMYAIG